LCARATKKKGAVARGQTSFLGMANHFPDIGLMGCRTIGTLKQFSKEPRTGGKEGWDLGRES